MPREYVLIRTSLIVDIPPTLLVARIVASNNFSRTQKIIMSLFGI